MDLCGLEGSLYTTDREREVSTPVLGGVHKIHQHRIELSDWPIQTTMVYVVTFPFLCHQNRWALGVGAECIAYY